MAARFLHADGWPYEELGRLFEATEVAVGNHVRGECDHPDLSEPLEPNQLSGAEIRALRRSKGLNQDELGEQIGVSRSTISNWESENKRPLRWRVYQLREVLEA